MTDFVPLRIAPGVIKDDTEYVSGQLARFVDTDKVRFRTVGDIGLPEAFGGTERVSLDQFGGICRGTHSWSDNSGLEYGAFGTHTKLYTLIDSELWDITPITDGDLGTDPLETTSGSSQVTVTDVGHGITEETMAYLNGLTDVGGLTIGGKSGSFASDPFFTNEGSGTIIVTLPSHTFTSNDLIDISGASDTNGIVAASINGRHTLYVLGVDTFVIQVDDTATSTGTGGGTPSYAYWKGYVATGVTDADTYTIDAGEDASSSATGGGSSGDVIYDLPAGLQDSTSGEGFGTGYYGAGYYGTSTSGDVFVARTWSLDNFGQDLVANPWGGAIYRWQRVKSQRAAQITPTDAPTSCSSIFVTPERFLFALGCTDTTGEFDPLLIRWATQEGGFAEGDWTATDVNTAGDLKVTRGSRLMKAVSAPFVSIVWTDSAAYQVRYLQDTSFVFGLDFLSDAGLIGPNAAASIGEAGVVCWIAQNKNCYLYTGGPPQMIRWPMRDWLFDNLEQVQEFKIFATPVAEFNEIFFFYPHDTSECDRYVAVNIRDNNWHNGTYDRTAGFDRGVFDFPVWFSSDGYVYYHEKGTTNDGASWNWSFETGYFDIQDGEQLATIQQIIPDWKDLTGFVCLILYSKPYPRGAERQHGPWQLTTATQKLDVRVTGRQIKMCITGKGSGTSMRLGEFRLDAKATGQAR